MRLNATYTEEASRGYVIRTKTRLANVEDLKRKGSFDGIITLPPTIVDAMEEV